MTLPDGAAQYIALNALEQAIYYLDRSLAPAHKVRAFTKAARTIAALEPGTLDDLHERNAITTLDGIGASTGAVIAQALTEAAGGTVVDGYLAKLERSTRLGPGDGASIRALLRGDCHSHTTWSDGGASSERMARTARALGHEYLVITDHSPRLTIAHGLTPERLAAQRVEIDELNRRLSEDATMTGFRVLRGSEVDILVDGSLDLDDTTLAELDVVVASVHSKLAMPHDDMTRRLIAAVSHPHVDILGHCTGRQILGTPRAPSTFDANAVFAACAEHGTAVEINCRPERQDPPDELLAIALEHGCLVAINTDAHAPGQLEWQTSGCHKAVMHNIAPERIVNTYSASELLDWTASAG